LGHDKKPKLKGVPVIRKLTASALIAAAGFVFASGAAFAADAKNGQAVFMDNCAVCHSFGKGEPNKIGPNLFGVTGRKSASAPGYMYSAAMTNSGLTWDEANLGQFLAGPQKKVAGTKMGFPGFSDPGEQADVIAYLATLK
jgi:cytochrome c